MSVDPPDALSVSSLFSGDGQVADAWEEAPAARGAPALGGLRLSSPWNEAEEAEEPTGLSDDELSELEYTTGFIAAETNADV